VLFMTGGASAQNWYVPANLLPAGGTADYLNTGYWAQKTIDDARFYGTIHEAASSKAANYAYIPSAAETKFSAKPSYVHYTSNNTIYGTQFHSIPEVPKGGGVPLVCDMCSDIFSRPIDISKFGLVYAGAQKNLGPSGVTVVIIREDLLARSSDSLPSMLNYRIHAENGSLYNTPPAFGIYILGLVLKWLKGIGGLPAIATINDRKAKKLYDELDRTDYWRPHADADSRSAMNITFRLPSEDLEKQFVKEATAAGFDGLKGHRSVGGLRASIYNAFPEAGIDALVAFMREFEKKNG
jgi:phosphoserine aminotransferase